MADSRRVLNNRAYKRDCVVVCLVVGIGAVDCIRVHKRTVSVEDKNIVLTVGFDKLPCLHYRMAGAELRLLKRGFDVRIKRSKVLLHRFMHIARNNAYILNVRFLDCGNNVVNHRLKKHFAHNLGKVAFHSCSLAAGKDNCTFHSKTPLVYNSEFRIQNSEL